MSFSTYLSAGAIGLAGAAFLALSAPGYAATAQSTVKACSQQYQAAKAAGTLEGQKWPQFLKKCSASMSNTAAPTAVTPATPTKKPAANTAAAAGAAAPGHQTLRQICSSQYQAAKSAGTLNGQKWPQFLSGCIASIKNDKSDAAVVPPDPTTTASTSAKPATSGTSATGKALSPGETAFRQRIRECANEWKSQKSAGTLAAGAKWPQFWSQCNTRLKAQN